MARSGLSEFDKELRHTIATNLKRITANCTQKEISERTGIPVSTISGYFAERSTINAGNVQKIANAFRVQKSDIDPRFKPQKIVAKRVVPSLEVDSQELADDIIDIQRNYQSFGEKEKEDLKEFIKYLKSRKSK